MKHVLGLDVAKDTLVAVLVDEQANTRIPAFTVANDPKGFRQLQAAMIDPANTHVVFEATGCCAKRLIQALDGKVASLHELNPCIVKRLATSMIQTKTDQADAAAIAQVGAQLLQTRPQILENNRVSYDPAREELTLWLSEYRRITGRVVALGLQIEELGQHPTIIAEPIQKLRQAELRQLKKQQRLVKQRIEKHLRDHRDQDAQLLQSIKGVGPLTAASLLVAIRRIDRFDSADALKGYLGTYPRRNQSGRHEGRSRMAKHGNKLVRHMLWNAAKSAARHNPICKDLYDRLVAKGKSPPSAYGAVCRKLVQLVYGVLINKKPFQIHPPTA